MSGDVDVIARVDSLGPTNVWAKAGVMLRSSLSANAVNVLAALTANPSVTFQHRPASGQYSIQDGSAAVSGPRWVRLVRAGDTITAYQAVDGATWTKINSITLSLGSTIYVGLAVTSHSPGVATTATVSSVAIKTPTTTTTGVPAPQKAADIGTPAITGSTTYASGKYTINAGGADIWNNSDQFHYVYQPLSGDAEIIARVSGLGASDVWAKAGVMVRETLAADSRHADALVSAGNGYTFQRRIDPSGLTVSNIGFSGAAPGWVSLPARADGTPTAPWSSQSRTTDSARLARSARRGAGR